MSQNPSIPPPGWYRDPQNTSRQRWWDGQAWTESVFEAQSNTESTPPVSTSTTVVAPLLDNGQVTQSEPRAPSKPTPSAPAEFPVRGKKKVRYYWDNLIRIRYWWFTLAGGFLVAFILSLVFPPMMTIAPLIMVGMGWFWLTVQMACRHCGRIFAAGGVKDRLLCAHCNLPTDAGLDSGQYN